MEKQRIGERIASDFSPDNILRVYHSATPDEIKSGMEWYVTANRIAESVGNGDIDKGAGIIAALSPSLEWGNNVIAAHDVVKTGFTKWQSKANIEKALRIRDGEKPSDVLGGNKVRSFYRNVSNPNDTLTVTIDRHAYSILVNRHLSDQEHKNFREPEYNKAVELYQNAAKQLGILPSQLQAITWLTWRRLKKESLPKREGIPY